MMPDTILARPARPLPDEQCLTRPDQTTPSQQPPEPDHHEKEFASLAHDIRTVANVLAGTSEALAQTMITDEQRQLVETMQFATDNLLALVNNFLDFKRLQAEDIDFHLQPFDLQGLVSGLQKAMLSRVGDRPVDVLAEIDPALDGLFPVLDGLKLRKILFNLLDNALKFTRQGSVTLCARLAKSDILEFQVRDTGPGIPAKALATIFDPFWQIAGQAAGGTGLGLTIVKELAERQGGHVAVESRPGEGTTFTVTLPFERNSPGGLLGGTAHGTASDPDALRNCSLLAVDDNPLSQQLLRRLFEKWHCRSAFASTAAEALELTEKRRFDLILLDINLPDQDGIALAALIRRSASGRNRSTPLIALSGTLMPRSSLHGIDAFVEKPFSSAGLQAVLKGFWQKKATTEANIAPAAPNFEWLLSYCEGDRKFAGEIVELFLQEAPESLRQLHVAVGERNTGGIYQLVHRLKSNFFALGIKPLEDRCLSIERLCMVPSADNGHILHCTEQFIQHVEASLPVVRERLDELH